MLRWTKEQRGSITLEAALVLPFFLAFLLLLIAFIRVSLAEMALQSAVSESAKVIAANMYPVELLYRQGQTRWQNSQASAWLDNVVTQLDTARQTVIDSEQFVEDYGKWIPEPVVRLVAWEKERREQLEALGSWAKDEAKKKVEQKVAEAATPMIASFADMGSLDRRKFKVTSFHFPNFDDREKAYVAIEAQYEYTFAVPFFKKTVILRKKAQERAWIGG
ncbi:TadE/TadG family type IV pilus assembly protein [Paenibacillus ehimensis]|uniref:TadE/TadG family type IV pilus assembly protein n=1 Tax=Paenibacillus ehimensis TaxID=79264 RepID=UPI002DBA1F3D|nr:TadE/TadG family type IV pilus assembly protein [Paenibacillus ehimensis]MEC0212110.1 TadE/TadG family type IV pilus assembly protein [Paenibacillus ehimensis]